MLTHQDRLEDYRDYYAATNATASLRNIEDSPLNEEVRHEKDLTPDCSVSQHWLVIIRSIALRHSRPFESSFTSGDEPELQPLESPFESLRDTSDDIDKIKNLIEHLRRWVDTPFAERIAKRLEFLIEASQEEEPEELPISPESLRNFIGFLQTTANLKYPDVVLTPSHDIWAEWSTAPNRHFAVEFLPNDKARFVIFAPDANNVENIIRLSGISSVDSLMVTAKPHGILNWITL